MSKEVGTYPGFEHRIKLATDTVPFVVKTRSILYALEEKVITAVKPLDEQGIWERADKGDWAHPMVTPAMPDDTMCITTDLSRLNKFVIHTCFPLQILSEIFQKVWRSAFLSTLDLMKAYHHIALDPESQLLTLTMTLLGPRQYIKMPLGLKDSGAVFQRCIHEALEDCPEDHSLYRRHLSLWAHQRRA